MARSMPAPRRASVGATPCSFPSYPSLKRVIDLAGAAAGLVLLSPVLLASAAAVLVTMGRPVFFRQQRPGLNGRPFTLIKFRTMADLDDAPVGAAGEAERMTPVGRFLRGTSIDELPELLNVLKGDMSLVGPRPLLMEYLPLYTKEQARRHAVRPGITGWAQVNGRNALSWEQKFSFDLWYIDNLSLSLDLRILGATLRQVLRRDGVNQPGHATAEPFRGTQPAVEPLRRTRTRDCA
jgi:sugar transferase EpsL